MSEPSNLLLLEFNIAGLGHYDAGEFPSEKLPIRLRLEREALNRYDPLAVAVYESEDLKLGYLPRTGNEVIARLMDGGKKITAFVSSDVNSWYNAIVQVFLIEE